MNCRLVALLFAGAWSAQAATTPIRFYTIADGLARNTVHAIHQDARGFLWFATEEGLSRFDGYRFITYGIEIGMPRAYVSDILQTRTGDYLAATPDGICRIPFGRQQCETIRPVEKDARRITDLFEDREGALWVGTERGLYRMNVTTTPWTLLEVDIGAKPAGINSIMQDRTGALWVAAANGLYRRPTAGSFECYAEANGLLTPRVLDVAEDAAGRIWAGTAGGGLYLLNSNPAPGRMLVDRAYTVKDGLESNWVQALLRTANGRFLVASGVELSDWTGITQHGHPPAPVILHEREEISTLIEDREGGVWVAVVGHGAGRIPNSGFTTFTEADGLRARRIDAILETQSGELCVLTKFDERGRTIKALGCLNGDRFHMTYPAFPPNTRYFGWGWGQIGFQDRAGEWWFAGGEGLYRFPAVRRPEDLGHTPPKMTYHAADGIGSDDIFRIFEDARGDIWIGAANRVTRWDRATGSFHSERLPAGTISSEGPGTFADDGHGSVWIGYHFSSGVARYRDGRVSLLAPSEGGPLSRPNHILRDNKGRIWIATSREGVARIDEPEAEHPRVQWIGSAQGLGSNSASCLAEDRWNRIYIAHGRGIDRLDPATSEIRHYTTADGLVTGEWSACYTAGDGSLWFATSAGLSRLVPQPGQPAAPPPSWLTGLYLRGIAQPIGSALDLTSDQNQLQIDFAAISFNEPLRYQYKLEGAGGDWSIPANTRTVNFASLAPGRYRFLVRAINAQGLPGEPASLRFSIAPPLWRRGWAEAGMLTILALAVYGAHRYRVRYLLAIERVRTRIASDLHDDIGANLSQIAILSELARHQRESIAEDSLSKIAQVSRETLRSMSDIIWAVDPERDRLSDLIHRMRRFGGDLLASGGLDLQFVAAVPDTEITSDVRRQVFLIYKEAMHNAARHSQASRVDVTVEIANGLLLVRVADNGRGFDLSGEHEGRGLANMRARARQLNGELQFHSDGTGTRVVLRTSLHVHAATRN